MTGPVSLCDSGFHAVSLPLDVLSYYPPGSSQYHEVQLDGVESSDRGNSKVVARKVTVGPALDLPGIVRAHVKAVWDRVKSPPTGRYANAVTTGNYDGVRASAADADAVAAVLGRGAARGVKGGWLVLTERDEDCAILGVQAVQVDGETIREGVYYALRGGKIVEA